MTRRTSVIIDDELVEQAQKALGTSGITDTIEAALNEAIRTNRRRRLIERFLAHDGYDDEALVAARLSWGRT